MSDSESYWAPNSDWVLVRRAMRPSSASRIMAMNTAQQACSKRWFMAMTMA